MNGLDLGAGIDLADLPDGGMLSGHVGEHEVLVARRGGEYFAVDAHCTHQGGPLAEGLLLGDRVRCPWHHACFNLRSGIAERAPALEALSCWRVEERGGKVYVGQKLPAVLPKPAPDELVHPRRAVIIGGGAAGHAAAEALRAEGYEGELVMLSDDDAPAYDRTHLSKGFLAGQVGEDELPLRPADFYRKHRIDLRLQTPVESLDADKRQVRLGGGEQLPFDVLLLATGAEPVRLDLPGADLPHVRTLRSRDDGVELARRAEGLRHAVVIGAGFIGLEVAAALRQRGVEVHVVARESVLMEKVLGPRVGQFLRALHESHGVVFHFGANVRRIHPEAVELDDGSRVAAELVVVGVGVRPRTGLAERAGLVCDRGVQVDASLETSVPGIFAAGDIARYPDVRSGDNVRIEHWVVAERMGQCAARNMLGLGQGFHDVPFFWTAQYDCNLNYVGHAEDWDSADFDGQLDLDCQDCAVRYRRGDALLAVATVNRDIESLRCELELEQATAGRKRA